jgi:signal transduction histidine kinase
MTTASSRSSAHEPRGRGSRRGQSQLLAATSSWRKLSFYGHALIYLLVCLLIAVTAGVFAAIVVGLAWGIGLASHGFFGVAAPALHQRWARTEAASPSLRVDDPAPSSRGVGEQRARSLEELSAAIAHEIRNPITAAKSLIQQIAEDPHAVETVHHAQVAVEELDRVERSIAHLLRFAREVPFDPAPLELTELLDSALDLMQERARRERVQLRRELDALPRIVADGEQLRAVIANLIANALDAHGEQLGRDPYVLVAAGQNLAGDEVWIRVRDNGPGISSEVADKIFRPFYTTKARGTGLGLALARKVLERHGGSLDLTSHTSTEHGAEFLLVLPIRAAV